MSMGVTMMVSGSAIMINSNARTNLGTGGAGGFTDRLVAQASGPIR
ncbi:MAG: hypothetical protein ABIP03_10350 [Aquihabitans sp.]